ncbi:MAG: biotin synthase BioB [Firmicutes bacterium]|nr:biotin synthase BioB [Alicyclobacillaceae bacterium]MCL6496517.1 biotin synthase BioB [Bacillota bacterium]
MSRWEEMADRVLAGEAVTREEALAIMACPDAEFLELLSQGYRLRRRYYGNWVRFQHLVNIQSGYCPEDCGYCSQSRVSMADIARYPLVDVETMVEGARRAHALGATTVCLVASGRGPNPREIARVTEAVATIKQELPVRVCACLGLLRPDQAAALKAAGVDRYNHNLNTSEAHTPAIVTTHGYQDRVRTVEVVKAAGISPCSGLIVGMGESDADLVDVAFALRALEVESIPINFLHPVPGTPLADRPLTPPLRDLKAVIMMRFVNPTREIRLAGGRELQLRSLQALGLYVANSLFVADYLTTPGQDPGLDHQMVRDLGFEVEPPGLELPLP